MLTIQTISLALSIVISAGTLICVTVPGLRTALKKALTRHENTREEICKVRSLLEKHVSEDLFKKEELQLQREVDRCVLRDLITSIYYRYSKEKKIPVYAMEDVTALYELYVKRGGNSYVQSLMRQILEEWDIIG